MFRPGDFGVELIRRLARLEAQVARLTSQETPVVPEAATTVGCYVYRSTDQSIPNAAWTALSFDTEAIDTGGFWDIANPTRFTATEDGFYAISAQALFTDGSNVTGVRQIAIRQNGTNFLKTHAYRPTGDIAYSFTTMLVELSFIYLASGDFLEICVFQGSGGALPVRKRESDANQFGNGVRFWRMI